MSASAIPQQWARLIWDAEYVRAWWGLGCGIVWQRVHRGEYHNAREQMDRIIEDIRAGHLGEPREEPMRQNAGLPVYPIRPTHPYFAFPYESEPAES